MWTFKVIRKESSDGGKEVKRDVKASTEKLLACRSCLKAEGKLYDLYKSKLAHHLKDLTGHPVLPTDGLPQHICNICSHLLQKAAIFRAQCERARLCLQYASLQLPKLTTKYIHSLDRSSFKIPLSFTGTQIMKISNDHSQPEDNLNFVSEEDETLNRVTKFDETLNCIDNVIKDNQQLQEVDMVIDNNDVKEEIDDDDDDFRTLTVIDDSVTNDYCNITTDDESLNKIKKNAKSDNRMKSKNGTVFFTTADVDFALFSKMYNVDVISFTREQQLEQMQRRKALAMHSRFSCDLCSKIFGHKTLLKNHLLIHDPMSGNHQCDICHVRFRKKLGLTRHLHRHKYRFKCKICDEEQTDSQRAKYHHQLHEGVRFPCEHCGKIFTKCASRVNHIRIHHATTPCDLCYDNFQGPAAVQMHKRLVHKQIFQCHSCNLDFDSVDAREKHLDFSDVCDLQMKPCRRCGENFATNELLTEHIQKEYRAKKQRGPNMGKLKCCPCSRSKRKKFTKNAKSIERIDSNSDKVERTSLTEHDYFKTDNVELNSSSLSREPTDSVECKVEVNSSKGEERSVGEEVNKQNGEEAACPCFGTCRQRSCPCWRQVKRGDRVICEMCPLSFPTKTSLKYHQRIHTGEKPFQCSYCDRRFRLKDLAKMHERVHTGERPYKCDVCEMRFKAPMNLYRHRMTHTGQRPYRCDVCQKRFTQANSLKAHVQTVHMRIRPKPRVRIKKKKIE